MENRCPKCGESLYYCDDSTIEEDGDTYGCSATVTIMHNRNIICKAIGNADAGNGGYYYSIASFCVKMPNRQTSQCHFVGSDDE